MVSSVTSPPGHIRSFSWKSEIQRVRWWLKVTELASFYWVTTALDSLENRTFFQNLDRSFPLCSPPGVHRLQPNPSQHGLPLWSWCHDFYICKELREKQHMEQREQVKEEKEKRKRRGRGSNCLLAKPKRITYLLSSLLQKKILLTPASQIILEYLHRKKVNPLGCHSCQESWRTRMCVVGGQRKETGCWWHLFIHLSGVENLEKLGSSLEHKFFGS